MKNYHASMLITIAAFSLCACASSGSSGFSSSSEPESLYSPSEGLPYSYGVNSDYANAAYGYCLNNEQGFNYWYYQYSLNGDNEDMSYANGRWESPSGYIDKAKMKNAVRTFVSPVSSKSIIVGNPRLSQKSSSQATVTIYDNGQKIYSQVISAGDTTGYRNEITAYLAIGDNLRFVVEGEGEVFWNPSIYFGNDSSESLHQKLAYDIGDVHPFYDNGKLYMFYLDTSGSFNSRLMVSDDFIDFSSVDIFKDKPQPVGEYYVLGVVKEGGVYRSYYGYSPYVINGSSSTDLVNWKDGSEYNYETMENEHLPKIIYKSHTVYSLVRDPYIFYDEDAQKYRIVYLACYSTGNDNYDAEVAMVSSVGNNTAVWEKTNTVNLPRFTRYGASKIEEPEVPQMMKIGNRWYLFAYMHNRTTMNRGISYWIGDENKGIEENDWLSKSEHVISSYDMVAAQVFKVEEKVYLYGWVSSHSGWGGTLSLPQQVYAKANGELGIRIDADLANKLKYGKAYDIATSGLGQSNNASSNGESVSFSSSGTAQIKTSLGRSLIETSVQSTSSFGLRLNNSDASIEIRVDKENQQIRLLKNGTLYATTEAKELKNDTLLKIIVDNNLIDIFVDETCSISADIKTDLSGLETQIYSDGPALFSDIGFYYLTNGRDVRFN